MLQSSSPFKSQSSALPNRPNVTVVSGHNGRYMATAAAAAASAAPVLAPTSNQFKTSSGFGGAEFGGNRMSHGHSNTSVALQQANRQRVKKETNL